MATQKIETGLIADSAVTTAKLADNSVTAAKIAAGSLDDQVKGISSSADAVAITIDSSEKVTVGSSLTSKIFNVVGTYENTGFYRDYSGAGVAANYVYIGRKDTNGALVDGVRISGGGDDAVAASHTGYFELAINKSGTFIPLLYSVNGTELVVNENSVDLDFRVESNGNANMLFVDGGNDRVGIGTTNPQGTFVISNSGAGGFEFTPDTTSLGVANSNYIASYDRSASAYRDIVVDLGGAESQAVRFKAGGNVGIGTSAPVAKLDIRMSDSNGDYGRGRDGNLNLENTNTSNTEGGWLSISGRMGNTASSGQYQMGYISGGKQTTAGDGDYGGYLTFWTTSGGANGEANSGGYERMRIDSSGSVGIGITPSEGKLHVKSDGSGEVELLTLENSTGTNGKTTLTFKTTSTDATKSAQIFAERVNASGHTDLAFRTYNGSTTEAVRIDHDGKVGIGTDNPKEMLHISGGGSGPEIRLQNSSSSHYIRAYNDNWNFLANSSNTAMTIKNSGQVNFGVGLGIGGTAAANTLDIYEEGTFTPTFLYGSFNYSTQDGRYTKIGRQVTLNVFLKWTSRSGSGVVAFANFPFSTVNSSTYRATGSLGYTAGLDFAGRTVPYVTAGGIATSAVIYVAGDNLTPVTTDVSNLSGSGELQLTITYITD